MLWILLTIGAACLLLLAASSRPDVRPRQRRRTIPDDMQDQIETDPAGALAAFGTPEDAARLEAEGIDLHALGYQPPDQ